jgi:2-phospho-L-lactate/phosphoenolpyruvate guanylyltransferase
VRDVAVVPVKSLSEAKHRLSTKLSPEERRRLVLAMLKDVLQAIQNSDVFSEILVVSPEETLENETGNVAVQFVKQKGSGLNAAIRQISGKLSNSHATSMTTILADLPLTGPKDFEEVAKISRENPRVVLAPSLTGGTNVIAMSPPRVIPNSYGRWSYSKHLRAGQKLGVSVYSISNSRLSFDVDTIRDLSTLRRLDPAGRTRAGRFTKSLSTT